MKKIPIFLSIIIILLSFSACEDVNTDTPSVSSVKSSRGQPLKETQAERTAIETVSESEHTDNIVTDEEIQGKWRYYDSEEGHREELEFEDGQVIYTSILDAVPDNPTVSKGEYTIYEDYVSIYFAKTDYTNKIDCTWINGELVLFKYIETGADKGNTRIYIKQGNNSETLQNSKSLEKESGSKPSTYVDVTVGMQNALQSAKNYLYIMPFSYTGLIEQLEFDGYSSSEATYAAKNCDADWYEQAAWSAKNYLDIMPFSRSGLIEQLEFEGYTYEQAVYGVDTAY